MAKEQVHRRKIEDDVPHSNGTKSNKETNGSTSHNQNNNNSPKPEKKCGWTSELVSHHLLPAFLADNEYLVNYHRQELRSFWECTKTVLRLHTETGNIWTHLAGSLFFVLALLYYWTRPFEITEKMTFSIFFIGAIFCMGMSAVYHLFLCHSEEVHKAFSRLDYVGVISLIVTSYSPWLYYGFYCNPHLQLFYVTVVASLGAVCIYVIVQDRYLGPKYRWLRAGVFIAFGLFGVAPAFHYALTEGLQHASHFASWLVFMAAIYIIGGIIYALRIPERLRPGMFDILLQSHQIMHMCVVAGALSCFRGAYLLSEYHYNLQDLGRDCPLEHVF